MILKRMRPIGLFLCALLFLRCLSFPVMAGESYYGDGTAVLWEDLAAVLPSPYNKTPYLNVVTPNGTKRYEFNREMYIDQGFLVYGDPSAAQDFGYANPFKAVENGYFRSLPGGNGISGEYRYLGVSISGVLQTNTHFPDDDTAGGPAGANLRVVKYKDLPASYQKAYAVPASGNQYFAPIQKLIDAPDSPAWDFTNNMAGTQVTLRSRFQQAGLTDFSLFEYGLVYSWAAGSGSIRLFFQLKDNPSVYRYATFVGTVSPEWQKAFPGLSCRLISEQVTAGGLYTMRPGEDVFRLSVQVEGTFPDCHASLSSSQKVFRFTREDVEGYRIAFESRPSSDASVVTFENDRVVFRGDTWNIQYNREDLSSGYHSMILSGISEIRIGGRTYQAVSQFIFYLYVMPDDIPSPTLPPPTESPSGPPMTPAPAGSWGIRRRW